MGGKMLQISKSSRGEFDDQHDLQSKLFASLLKCHTALFAVFSVSRPQLLQKTRALQDNIFNVICI